MALAFASAIIRPLDAGILLSNSRTKRIDGLCCRVPTVYSYDKGLSTQVAERFKIRTLVPSRLGCHRAFKCVKPFGLLTGHAAPYDKLVWHQE